MKIRNLVLSLLMASGTVLAPAAGHADSRVSIGIAFGPPAPVVVAPPLPPRPGFVWAPGFWDWDGYRYVWLDGRWIAPRPGYVWVPDRWQQRGPRWYRSPGHWQQGHDRGHHRGHYR